MPQIDVDQLDRHLKQRRRDRSEGAGLDGRASTGATAVIRQHLGVIEKHRAKGAKWAEIAEGLALQGVTQGDGQPITARRLTALVTKVRQQIARKAEAQGKRSERGDLSAAKPASSPPPQARLAPELMAISASPAPMSPADREEAIRRGQAARHQHLFGKE